MVRFDPEITEIVFFDLEFYVPKADRDKPGVSLLANPYKKDHFLLGGVFCKIFPLQKSSENPKFEHYWTWEMKDGEKAVLTRIYDFFQEAWKRLSNKDPWQADLIAVGLGISKFDIPVLFTRSLILGIARPEELFECYFKLKQVDLNVVGIGFSSQKTQNEVLYPKTANELLDRFGISKVKTSGMLVWDMYDAGDRQGIRARTENEVRDAVQIYWKMRKELLSNHPQSAL